MKVGKNTNIIKELSSFAQDDPTDAFTESYQWKFLKVFIEDKNNWYRQIMDIMFPEYFDGYYRILINYQIEYFKKYHIQADYSELIDIISDKNKDEIVKDHLFALVNKIKTQDIPKSKMQSIKDRAYAYFKSQKIKNTLIELASDWKHQTYESMKKKLEDALKAGESKDIGHDYILDVEARMKKDYRDPVSALAGLDNYIGGGLAGGELGVVLAPPGIGKSMMLVRFATSALLQGKKIVYYSLELSEKVIGQRFDACLNNIEIDDVWNFKEIIKEKICELKQKNSGLVIKSFPKATINNIYSHLETLASNENFIPDIIFIDYADIMRATTKYTDKRHALTSIYEDVRALAVEFKIPIWTASQTNRGAMEKEKYNLDSIGESLGKAATADIIISIGRTNDFKNEDAAVVGILKNRNGRDGIYLNSVFDTSRIKIEILNNNDIISNNKNNVNSYVAPGQRDATNIANILKQQKQ